jgi:hypothetical protein
VGAAGEPVVGMAADRCPVRPEGGRFGGDRGPTHTWGPREGRELSMSGVSVG